MSSDASAALAVRQKVQQFLNAARTGNLDLFKKLAVQLDEEGKGLARTVADVKDANRRGALHFAAREGKTDVCKFLIEDLKLGVDVKDDDGETPLLHAVRQGQTATAKYLLEHGADPAASSELGTTPLHHAAGIGNTELLSFLISKGVDVDSQSDVGTPLIWAAGHAQQDAVKILLEHHANRRCPTLVLSSTINQKSFGQSCLAGASGFLAKHATAICGCLKHDNLQEQHKHPLLSSLVVGIIAVISPTVNEGCSSGRWERRVDKVDQPLSITRTMELQARTAQYLQRVQHKQGLAYCKR